MLRQESSCPGTHVRVQGRGGEPLPIVTTDEQGVVQFEDMPPGSVYTVRIQKVDYFVTFEPSVAVTEGEVTEITVAIEPQPGGRLYVGLDDARVAEIDTASFLIVRTLRFPEWRNEAVRKLGVHPSEDLLYVVTDSEGGIIDERSGAVLERFEADGLIEALSVDASVLTIFADLAGESEMTSTGASSVRVAEYGQSGQLLTLDARTGALLDSSAADSPRMSPLLIWRTDGEELYVIEPSDGSLWKLDVNPHEALIYSTTGALPKEGLLSSDGNFRYLWSLDPLAKLETTFQDALMQVGGSQVSGSSPAAFSLSPTGQNLYALNDEFGTLSVIDLTGEEPPTLVAVGKRPTALVVSPGGMWAYVANRQSMSISVVHLPSLRVVQTISIDGEPLSLTIR